MENEKLNEILGKVYASLTDEQKEKAKDCKDVNEFISTLGEMGVALPDELLDAVAGGTNAVHRPMEGWVWGKAICKSCGDTFGYKYYYNICLNVYGENGTQEQGRPDYCPKCENPAEYIGR